MKTGMISPDKEIVKGWQSLRKALTVLFPDVHITTKKGESNKRLLYRTKKSFFRTVKKYNLPLHKERTRIYMFKKDIEIINRDYLFGMEEMADYLGIHIRTLEKWVKRYPKMPVDRTRKIAFIDALNLWYATLIFDHKKKGKATEHFNKGCAPIMVGFGKVFFAMERNGLSHPKALRQYWLHPENDILNTLL